MTEQTTSRGEGNPDADRRYRKGVRETIETTSAEQRRKQALDMSEEDKAAAEQAEAVGKSKAKS